MATSGIYTRGCTRNQLITDAFIRSTAVDQEQDITAADMQTASRFLNKILMALKIRSENTLFLLKDVIIFLTTTKNRYTFPGDKACSLTDFFQTSISPALSGATTVTVAATSSVTKTLAIGDHFGVSDGTNLFWTTVTNISSLVVTLATPLPKNYADNSAIYSYTTTIPYKIMGLYAITLVNRYTTEIPVQLVPRYEYARFPQKNIPGGIPNTVTFSPNRATSELMIWQFPATEEYYYRAVVQTPIEMMLLASDELSLPDEWELAITTRLAYEIASFKMVPAGKVTELFTLADGQIDACLAWSRGDESFYVVPDYDGGYGDEAYGNDMSGNYARYR